MRYEALTSEAALFVFTVPVPLLSSSACKPHGLFGRFPFTVKFSKVFFKGPTLLFVILQMNALRWNNNVSTSSRKLSKSWESHYKNIFKGYDETLFHTGENCPTLANTALH